MCKYRGNTDRFEESTYNLFDRYKDETEEKEITVVCVLCCGNLAEDETEMCVKCQNKDDDLGKKL